MFWHRKIILLVVAILGTIETPVLAWQTPMDKEAKAIFVATPEPEYPAKAIAQRISGTGMFKLICDEQTGRVTRVEVLQSTGYKILDEAAARGLAKWRIKPHTLGAAVVSYSYHLGDRPDDLVLKRFQEARRYATYAPLPRAPRRAFHTYARMGAGWYRLAINPQTGLVTKVTVVETTRSIQLDEAAKKTFLEWRFQPHTVTTIVLPAFF